MTLGKVVESAVAQWGSREFIVYDGFRMTFKRFGDEVGRWKRMLLSHGFGHGDRAVICADNSPQWCAAYLAVVSAGGIAVPVDTHMRGEQLIALLRASEARVIMISESTHDAVEEVLTDVPTIENVVILDGIADEASLTMDDDLSISDRCDVYTMPDDVCTILFTAGTTGEPKGVPLTHRSLLSGIAMALALIEGRHEDMVLNPLPLYHVFPLVDGFLAPFCGGMSLVLARKVDRGEMNHLVSSLPVSIVICVPALYRFLADRMKKVIANMAGMKGMVARWITGHVSARSAPHVWRPLKSLLTRGSLGTWKKVRLFISGGAELDKDAMELLNALGFPLMEGYGLTETCAAVSFNVPHLYRRGSVGRPDRRWVDVKIDHPDEDGNGEILLRGPTIMAGYLDAAREKQFTKDGYFRTGDIGHIDDDGFLFVTGRQKDVIVPASGKNIYPIELELHYERSSLIKDISIVGLRSAKRRGESVHAAIVPKDELLAQGEEAAYEWLAVEIDKLSRELPVSKRIRSFSLWRGGFPRASTGKVRKFEIRKQLLDALRIEDEPVRTVRSILLARKQRQHRSAHRRLEKPVR